MREELISKQIEHVGGNIDSGISPYLSASWDAREALGYTKPDGALLVIDIPLSQIQDFSEDATETNIKGTLDSKYITAIIPRNGVNLKDDEVSQQAIVRALQTVSETVPIPIYDLNETKEARVNQFNANEEKDQQQRQIDVEAVRQKRTAYLVTEFSNLGLNIEDLQKTSSDTGTDVYTEAKRRIFDHYAERIHKMGKVVNNFDYLSGISYGKTKPFDRNEITDEMLYNLRKEVLYLEKKEERFSWKKYPS